MYHLSKDQISVAINPITTWDLIYPRSEQTGHPHPVQDTWVIPTKPTTTTTRVFNHQSDGFSPPTIHHVKIYRRNLQQKKFTTRKAQEENLQQKET